MEYLFYVAASADVAAGTFGTATECAAWVFAREPNCTTAPDPEDPLTFTEQFGDAYLVRPAQEALPLLMTPEEAKRLPGIPDNVESYADVMTWLHAGVFDVVTVRAMADRLHERSIDVRWRGENHRMGQSPFTGDQFDQLIKQISR